VVSLPGPLTARNGDSFRQARTPSPLSEPAVSSHLSRMVPHGFRGGERDEGRIDWILFRAPWKVTEAETITMKDGNRYPSDHYPVMAIFELP
jgi:endonuclease/exonuclease/phosphatase family metal-dependent hydrolase